MTQFSGPYTEPDGTWKPTTASQFGVDEFVAWSLDRGQIRTAWLEKSSHTRFCIDV